MTEETKKSAGYYDSVRNTPIYEGDVFYDEGMIEPFYRVVHTEDQGFVVHHVGSTETYKLSDEGALLIKRQYIGNEKENPDIIKEFKEKLSAGEKAVVEANEEITNVFAPATETQKEVLEKADEVEKANNELHTANEELKEKLETKQDDLQEVIEIAENAAKEESNVVSISTAKEKEAETNEQISGNNSDDATEESTGETTENATGNDNSADETEKTTGKNVIVEVAKEAVPEVIANTKDEKQAVLRKKFVSNLIKKNEEQIALLEKKVTEHTELASTLDFQPFVKLKKLVCAALHENVDEENIKDLKARTKDFESILNIQDLLKEHKNKAHDAECEITDLEDENSKLSDELAELEAKIDKFAAQTKLPS